MKVAVIGGGSFGWTIGFVRQFANSQFLTDVSLTLMDLNPEALDLVGRAVDIYNRAHGSRLAVERTTELYPALDGADFVLIAITTGGLRAMRHDIEIPERYGIFHTVGDTVGPGGWLRAVRNIPVFTGIAEQMSALCPNAWLLNVSNPLTVLTRAPGLLDIKTVGMCPEVEMTARRLAVLAGFSRDCTRDYTVTGIDHGSWFTSLFADGADVIARLREMGFCTTEDPPPWQARMEQAGVEVPAMRAGFAVWHELGYLPSLGDRHTTENWPWFLAGSSDLPYGVKRTSTADREQWAANERSRLEKYIASGSDDDLGALGHGDDPVVDVIEALSGYKSFLWGANLANVGQIPQLPLDAVVETRCRFDAAGVHPLASPMPRLLQTLVLPHVHRQEAILGIALDGGFDDLVALVMTDPLCSRLKMGQCRQMVREMLEANRPLIKNPRLLEF